MDRAAIATEQNGSPSAPPAPAPVDKKRSLAALPLFKKASEALGAQIWHVDDDFNPTAAPPPTSKAATDQDIDGDAGTDTDEA